MSTQQSPGLAALGLTGEGVVRTGAVGEAGSLIEGGSDEKPSKRDGGLEKQSAVEKIAKPIKPIRDKSGAPAPSAAGRGPDGRFLPVTNPDGSADPLFEAKADKLDAVSSEQPVETPDGEQDGQPEDSGAEKFMFGGVEFESREKAEQAFRTQRGMHKRMESDRQAALKNRDEHIGAYSQLRAEYDRLVEYVNGGGQPVTEGRTAGDGASYTGDVFVESLGKEGWTTFQSMYEQSPARAIAWLQDQNQQYTDARVEAKIDAKLRELTERYDSDLEPVREKQAQHKALVNVTDFFYSQADAVDDNGEYLYPEFREQEGADPSEERKRILSVLDGFMPIWQELVEASPQSWHSPVFLKQAMRAYRADLKSGAVGRGESPASDALLDSVRDQAGAAGRAVVDGGSPTRPASRTARDEKTAFVRELVGANKKSPFGNFSS